MSIDFTPSLGDYKDLSNFRFWCNTVLPAVYDDSLSYYELLTKVVNYLNVVINNTNTMGENVSALYNAYVELQGFVNHYFDNLDVQNEINGKLDVMSKDGSLSALIQPLFDAYKHEINVAVAEQNGEIATLNSRMNTFTNLPSGSTTGDAELVDARVDHTGKVHDNVGEHIRNVTKHTNFFDTDLVHGRFKSLLPVSYSERDYDGVAQWANFGYATMHLEYGEYALIIPDSNAMSVYLTEDTGNRFVISNLVVGAHRFSVTNVDGSNVTLQFNISTAELNVAGKYYAHYYLYKMDGEAILPSYLLEDDTIISLCNTTSKVINNVTKYHDGVAVYDGINTTTFKLEAGSYRLCVYDNDFVGLYVMVRDGNNTRLLSTFSSTGVNGYYNFSVSEEQAKFDIYILLNCCLATPGVAGTYKLKKLYIVKDDGKPVIHGDLTGYNELKAKLANVSNAVGVRGGYFTKSAGVVTSGAILQIDKLVNVKKNNTTIFTCEFSEFSGVYVGHGKTSYGGSYIQIDGNTIRTYNYTTGAQLINTVSHGLSIKRFLTVVIKMNTNDVDITLFTEGGSFTTKVTHWSGCNGYVFAEPIGMAITNAVLKWTTSDASKPVWVFGDSYLGLTSASRYPYHLLKMGFDNWLASGYAGGNSSAELASLKSLLELGAPNVLVWCLGMNDGDNGSVNANWNSCVNEVMALCEERGIQLVLATIPNCPIVDNTYKNNIVRNSGYRYVDFNKIVVSGTTWINGALSSDGVHPTELGAKILCNQFIVDVPEITITD